jgi:hypothetical protein
VEPISLNEITRWSPWPARLLGLEKWDVPTRTPQKVEAEYNLDKYARCLAFARSAPDRGPSEVKDFEFGGSGDDRQVVSVANQLYITSLHEARRRFYDLLADTLAPALAPAGTVVELGCGYGYNLWLLRKRFPGLRYLGGEFSTNAVELAAQLYAGDVGCSIRRFDFYQSDFTWVDESPAPLVVFTCHALEQIPQCTGVVRRMAEAFRGKLIRVFHFEPVLGLHDDSLLGQMRQRYICVNDYNTDLWAALQSVPSVRVRQVRADLFGINPLNPTSVLEWTAEEG